jgi:hypothetical protein
MLVLLSTNDLNERHRPTPLTHSMVVVVVRYSFIVVLYTTAMALVGSPSLTSRISLWKQMYSPRMVMTARLRALTNHQVQVVGSPNPCQHTMK